MLRAGPGFGKTTLLMQALERNLSDPLGIDVWLGCGPQDDRAGELGFGLLGAVGVQDAEGPALEAICDAVWKQSPHEVALLLDDVHYLSTDGTGAALLNDLLRELPANAHLVLAGRAAPPVPTARLVASGQALVLDEDALAFDAAEQAAFLELRGRPAAGTDARGWPAVLELSSSSGPVDAYLWEEVLANVSPERRRDLARLSGLEWVDAARVAAFTGRDQSVAELVTGLPLTSFDPDGAARLHALWEDVLKDVDRSWTEDELTRALDHLLSTSHYREAIGFCTRENRERELPEVVRQLIRGWIHEPVVALETVIALLPEAMREEPLGLLLRGLLRMRTAPSSARPLLEQARAGLVHEGDLAGELAAVAAISIVNFWCGNVDGLIRDTERVEKLGIAPFAAAGRCMVAILTGRPHEALELVAEISRMGIDFGGGMEQNAIMAYLDAGMPAAVVREGEAAYATASTRERPSIEASLLDARWLLGEIDTEALARYDDGFTAVAMGHAHNATVALSLLSFQNACLGRDTVARSQLEQAEAMFDPEFGDRADMALAVARMAVLALEGDEPKAARAIEASIERHREDGLPHRHTLRGMPLACVVSERARARFRTWQPEGCYAVGLEAALALVAARAGDSAPAAALPWNDWLKFRVYLLPSMLLELAVAAIAGGNPDANAPADELALRERDVLRRLSSSDETGIAAAARDLLQRVPARPTGRLELRVLGSLVLARDGVEIDDPALRRGRVRDLLQYLVSHRSCRREELAVAVWPEHDAASQANNLRVNLRHVLRLLEPDRKTGEPSFFIPHGPERLSLRVGDGLEVDVDRFRDFIDRADKAEAAGQPALALERFEQALALYRGEYLVDVADPEWSHADRIRLRSDFVRAAIRAAELRLGRGDPEHALRWAERATAEDDLAESGYRLQALVYQRLGDRSAARAALRLGLERLAAEGFEAEPESLALARRLRVDAPT